MHHTKKKKYASLREQGKTAEELTAIMIEEGIPVEEAEATVAELYALDEEEPKEKAASGKKSDKKVIEVPATANKTYEEWKLDNEGGKLVQSRKVKDVKLTPDRAARLNEHKENRRIEYVEKGGANA